MFKIDESIQLTLVVVAVVFIAVVVAVLVVVIVVVVVALVADVTKGLAWCSLLSWTKSTAGKTSSWNSPGQV